MLQLRIPGTTDQHSTFTTNQTQNNDTNNTLSQNARRRRALTEDASKDLQSCG